MGIPHWMPGNIYVTTKATKAQGLHVGPSLLMGTPISHQQSATIKQALTFPLVLPILGPQDRG